MLDSEVKCESKALESANIWAGGLARRTLTLTATSEVSKVEFCYIHFWRDGSRIHASFTSACVAATLSI